MNRVLSLICVICLMLSLCITAFAEDPVVEVEAVGNVHIRRQPNLDGEDMGVLNNGDTKPFGCETSVDERGVVWYLAGMDDEWGWISSRYSMLTDGTTDDLDFDVELADTEFTMLSDDTLAVSPLKGIGETNVEQGAVVEATGYSFTDGEDTWYLVSFEGDNGWINALNVEIAAAE